MRAVQQGLPLQEVAALRAAASASSFKPAEEQFIEKTPWANPQHPSHAHLIQRQSSSHTARTSSPFALGGVAQARKHSHQHASSGPVSGTFSSATPVAQTNGTFMPVGRVSPMNPFTNSTTSQKVSQATFSHRNSVSPQETRDGPNLTDHLQREGNLSSRSVDIDSVPLPGAQGAPYGFSHDGGVTVKREQPVATNGQY